MDMEKMRTLLAIMNSVFLRPTSKQKEAYGRFLHTLSAACMVGAVWIAFTESQTGHFWSVTGEVAPFVLLGLALFIVGGILSKGE